MLVPYPPKACHIMLHLIEGGPVHPLHIKNFLKRFYPNSLDISHQMMFNFQLKYKELQQKFGSLRNVPTEQAHAVLNPSSLENAPEQIPFIHKYSNKQCKKYYLGHQRNLADK